MDPTGRQRFDILLTEVIESLPPPIAELLEETPVIVDDRPDPNLLRKLIEDEPGEEVDPETLATELCGLHSGVAMTERSVEDPPDMPTEIYLFREGIVLAAGGWHGQDADDRVREEIRITLLHEIGHHYGLDEDDLARLGYQ